MTTITEIRSMLEDQGVGPIYRDDEYGLLLPVWVHGRAFWTQVMVLEEGAYVRFCVPGLSTIHGIEDRAAAMEMLLAEDRNMKLAKFGVDPSDGGVDLEISVYLGENPLTNDQIGRMLFTIRWSAMTILPRLEALPRAAEPDADMPEPPTQDEIDDFVKALLERGPGPDFETKPGGDRGAQTRMDFQEE